MKNYSCSWSISYNVTSLISYGQSKGSDHAILKFLILRGAGFEMHKIFRTSHILRNKGVAGLGLPSSRLLELSSSLQLMTIFVPLTNLLVLSMSSQSPIRNFSSCPIIAASSLSVYTSLFSTIFLPVLDNTSNI